MKSSWLKAVSDGGGAHVCATWETGCYSLGIARSYLSAIGFPLLNRDTILEQAAALHKGMLTLTMLLVFRNREMLYPWLQTFHEQSAAENEPRSNSDKAE